MKALVFNGPRDIRYESFDDPELTTAGGAIVKVDKCSICGSDLHIYHGDRIGANDYAGEAEKFCVGHEFIGEVVETGKDAHGLKTGDRVLAAGGSGCGRCTACLTGKSRCPHTQVFGLAPTLNGGQAEFVNVPNPSRTLLPIPDGVSDEQALLMTDAMATASFGINNADIRQSGTVAVVGLGPIGLIGVELALLKGASKIYAIDPVAERRAHAEKLGAVALPPGKETIGLIREQTRGGVHSVFEASGAKPAVESTLRLVRQQGTISMIGLPQADVSVSLMPVLFNNVTLRAGVAPVSDMWGGLIPLLQHGRLKAEGLFSHHMGLDEGREAYQLFDARDDGVVIIMMQVG